MKDRGEALAWCKWWAIEDALKSGEHQGQRSVCEEAGEDLRNTDSEGEALEAWLTEQMRESQKKWEDGKNAWEAKHRYSLDRPFLSLVRRENERLNPE